MKRVLTILGAISLTALITYLAVSKHLAEERAAKLDRALLDAEARMLDLEEQIANAKQQLADLARSQEAARPVRSSLRGPQAAPAPQTVPGDVVVVADSPSLTTKNNTVVSRQALAAAGPWIRFAASSDAAITNLVRIAGTSSVHDWQVEGHLIGGSAEFGPTFPALPGAKPVPGVGMDAKVSAFIPVRSLKSVHADGQPFSEQMDEIMYAKLRDQLHRRITYLLTSLTAKAPSEASNAPLVYEATGNLAVAGVTNAITMPLAVSSGPGGRLRFEGSVRVKMTDFNIVPPAPSLGGVSIKTGDEVTLSFVWWVNRTGRLEVAR